MLGRIQETAHFGCIWRRQPQHAQWALFGEWGWWNLCRKRLWRGHGNGASATAAAAATHSASAAHSATSPPAGRPLPPTYGRTTSNGRATSYGRATSNGRATSYGRPISNGWASSNGRAASNGRASSNGRATPYEWPTSNGWWWVRIWATFIIPAPSATSTSRHTTKFASQEEVLNSFFG